MVSKRIMCLYSTLIALSLLGCRQGDKATDNNISGKGTQAEVSTSELPMPDVPDSLQSVEERAAYVVAHYWDAMDFTDRALSLDTAFIEQNFANFAAILPMSPPDEADRGLAADFGFVDRNGSSTTLMRELAPNPLNLLIFYDPDCSQCKEIMGRLSALALPPEIGIIAVDVEDDHDAWQRTKDTLPARWHDGLYVLAASPTLYLLDSTGKVILKDPPVDQAIAALTR